MTYMYAMQTAPLSLIRSSSEWRKVLRNLVAATIAAVALGTAVGAVVASLRMRLDQATRVMPLGIAMGVLVILMNFIDNVWVAAPFLVLLGGLGGFLVVPMNALLQHRGHNLMGAGRSCAVQ
eukprot:gene37342-48836_t